MPSTAFTTGRCSACARSWPRARRRQPHEEAAEMDDARFRTELRHYWDEIARGEAATPGDLDPDLAALIPRLHALPDVPPPDPTFASRLRESLMHATTTPLPLTDPRTNLGRNGQSAPLARRPIVSAFPVS